MGNRGAAARVCHGNERPGGEPDKLAFPMGLAFHEGCLYVADAGNHRVVRLSAGAAGGGSGAEVVLGGEGRGRKLSQLVQPRSVAFHAGGLYVADSGNCRVLWVPPGASRAELCLGGRGSSLRQLSDPCGLAVHEAEGLLYISDFGNHRILGLRLGGAGGPAAEAELCFGGRGRGDGLDQLAGPAAVVALGGGALLVADFWNHRVLLLQRGAAAATVCFGGRGRGSGLDQLHGPRDLALHGGLLYIADWGNGRVLRVRPGAPRAEVFRQGECAELGGLRRPRGLGCHRGHLYVADSENHRLLACRA